MGHTGALLRGGNFNNGTNAGPLTVNGNNEPSSASVAPASCPVRVDAARRPVRIAFTETVPVPMG